MTKKRSDEDIKTAVREHYAAAITQSQPCCGPKITQLGPETSGNFITLAGYSAGDIAQMPESVTSFGCGNPVNFMDVRPGQTVLDLGSGAGLDLILAARKVGPNGKVIGLDMTPEMIAVCKKNLAQAGVKNYEVLHGEMEAMPIPAGTVDWIISNCVINLSPDKAKVFAEAYRVLKPGGQILVSDIVAMGMPDEFRDDIRAWVGCIAGALEEEDYLNHARRAGFTDVKVVDKLVYTAETLNTLANGDCGCGTAGKPIAQSAIDRYAGKIASVKVYARRS